MEEGKAKQNKTTLSSTGSENQNAKYMRLNEMFAQAPKRLYPVSRGRVVCTPGSVSLAVLVTPRLGRHGCHGEAAAAAAQAASFQP